MWLIEAFLAQEWWEQGLVLACITLLLLPPKYDPAIRLKEWIDGLGR